MVKKAKEVYSIVTNEIPAVISGSKLKESSNRQTVESINEFRREKIWQVWSVIDKAAIEAQL